MEVHKESWDVYSPPEKFYIIKHELLHIHEDGFILGEPGYKKLIQHDVEDFRSLLNECGVYKEKIKDIFGEDD